MNADAVTMLRWWFELYLLGQVLCFPVLLYSVVGGGSRAIYRPRTAEDWVVLVVVAFLLSALWPTIVARWARGPAKGREGA